MSQHKAFDASSCFRRISQAAERFNEVCAALADIGQLFEATPELKIESVEDAAKLLDMLSEHLVARALAEEGLAIIDQIESEVGICNRSPEMSNSADLSRAAQALASVQNTAASRKTELEQFLALQEQIIQSTMTSVQQLETSMEEIVEVAKRITRSGTR